MILSTKPLPPLILPCPCGCGETLSFRQQVRHIVLHRWRYRMRRMLNGTQWGGVAIEEAHYFQPRHRRARRWWRDTHPHPKTRRQPRPRCVTRRLTRRGIIS